MWEQTRSIFLDSLQRVVNAAARLLPRLLAVAAVVVLSVALALVVRLLVRRICKRLEVDRRAQEWGFVAPGGPGTRPALLAERLAGWSIVAGGFLIGLWVVDATASNALAIRLVDFLPHALLAVVTLAVVPGVKLLMPHEVFPEIWDLVTPGAASPLTSMPTTLPTRLNPSKRGAAPSRTR